MHTATLSKPRRPSPLWHVLATGPFCLRPQPPSPILPSASESNLLATSQTSLPIRSASEPERNPLSSPSPVRSEPACRYSSCSSIRCALHPPAFERQPSRKSAPQSHRDLISLRLYESQSNDCRSALGSPADCAAHSCC